MDPAATCGPDLTGLSRRYTDEYVLETLIEQSEYRSAAAELLEPIYLRRMEWAKVTQILEARLDGETDPTQRMELPGKSVAASEPAVIPARR